MGHQHSVTKGWFAEAKSKGLLSDYDFDKVKHSSDVAEFIVPPTVRRLGPIFWSEEKAGEIEPYRADVCT